ncbi:hypothetical protein ACFZDK_13650 [Streptomyces sp. NPDC007901]|uniref:hypothetical protein n=1 Tax=Streptomyces sp. NPDC007901 TaxID=3364785 RepID=UPI0036F04942
MAAEYPPDKERPGGEDGGVPVPDAVWRRFLDDTEQAIRASAPREPSAQERAAGVRHGPTEATGLRWRFPAATYDSGSSRTDHTVGDLWDPEDQSPTTGWRDLDGSGKLRRAGRVLAVVAAVIVAVGALSRLPTRSAFSDASPDGGTTQQSGDVLPDGVPTATGGLPPGPTHG